MFPRVQRTVRSFLVGIAVVSMASPAFAAVALDEAGRFTLYGDFRFRVENDSDSHRSDGTQRDSRNRARIRTRLGVNYKPTDNISMGARIRSGNHDSQQSPHITVADFDDNSTGDIEVNFDKWFVNLQNSHVSGWVGRNSLPFWKQNELFWDDDVTPAGVAAKLQTDLGDGNIALNAGHVYLPAGMRNFSGDMTTGQLVYSTPINQSKLTLAAGVLAINADEDDSDGALLLQGNSMRDYTIWIGSAQFKTSAGDKPLVLGADVMHNSEDYSATDPDALTAFHNDETDGYVLSAKWGQTKEPCDWLLGYYYAHIETFAVNNSYSQDDWLRWGSATQTRASNFEGHEFRVALGLGNNWNVVGRYYLVDAIELLDPLDTRKEDGNRGRIDFNWKF